MWRACTEQECQRSAGACPAAAETEDDPCGPELPGPPPPEAVQPATARAAAQEMPRACLVDLGRRERPSGGMDRKAEEEPIAELLAATTTPRDALRRTRSRLKICETRPSTVSEEVR